MCALIGIVWEVEVHIEWGPFLIALAVLIVIPGPDFVLVTRNAANGTRWGWIAAAGVTCGLLVHATAATLGLSALMVAVPGALVVVKAVGAVYLIHLGIQALRTSGTAQRHETVETPRSARAVFLRAVLIDLLNPKVMLTFLTLLPQAMDPHGAPMAQAALLSGVSLLAFALWWVVVVPSVRRLADFLAQPRRRQMFERCCGGALLAMATSIAFA